MRAAIHLENLRPALQPILVKQPDGTHISSTHRAYLPGLAHLRREAARVDIFRDQDLPHTSLMSLGQLCDAGCEAHLDAKALMVSNPDTTPLYRGERNRATGLWDVDWRNPLPALTSTSATNEVSAPQASPPSAVQHGGTVIVAQSLTSNAQRVGFYHAALGSPPVATLLTALRANILPTLPIDIDMVRKAPPTTMATAKGHLDARRQGIQSTRPPAVEDPECSFPVGDIRHTPGAAISVMISPAKCEVDIDPTGRLSIHTEWGGDYHVVFYHHDSNYIHVETCWHPCCYSRETRAERILGTACAGRILHRPGAGSLPLLRGLAPWY
jgi:hypothetical protein